MDLLNCVLSAHLLIGTDWRRLRLEVSIICSEVEHGRSLWYNVDYDGGERVWFGPLSCRRKVKCENNHPLHCSSSAQVSDPLRPSRHICCEMLSVPDPA